MENNFIIIAESFDCCRLKVNELNKQEDKLSEIWSNMENFIQ